MRFVEPLSRRVDAPLARRNAVAKMAGVTILTLSLLATLDPVTPSVVLVVELAAAPFFGLSLRTLARRAWPVLVSVAFVVVGLLLFTPRTGSVLVALGPFTITTGTATAAVSVALRLFAVALPGIIVLATTDPTDLADSLVQNAKASPRYAFGALAAFRLLPLLSEEWRMLTLARRARGIDAGRNPAARVRLFASLTFALLVGAIRRGTRLATAMDARGFDSGLPRSIARPQYFGPADWLFIVACALLATLALTLSVATGAFTPLIH